MAPFTWQYSPLVSASVVLVTVAPLVGSAIEDAGIDSPFNAAHCVAADSGGGELAEAPPPEPLPPHALMQKLRASAHHNRLLFIVVSWLI
jgi:hypothetical protein